MAYKINWETDGVCKVFTGKVDGQQLLDSVVEIEQDIRFDKIRYVINDFIDIDDINVTNKEIAIVAAIDRAASMTNPNIRIAVITQKDKVRELAAYYGELMQDCSYQTQLFGTVEDARNWAH